jgi:hypothetical protein
MDRSRRWHGRRRRCDFRDNNAVRFTDDSHGQKLRSRLLRGPADTVFVLVSPLEHLVRVYTVLSRNSCDRRTRNKCRLDNAPLLLSATVNPFRRSSSSNLNRLAHKAIVGLTRVFCLHGEARTLTPYRQTSTGLSGEHSHHRSGMS